VISPIYAGKQSDRSGVGKWLSRVDESEGGNIGLQRQTINQIAGGLDGVVQSGDVRNIELDWPLVEAESMVRNTSPSGSCNPTVRSSGNRSSKVNNFQMRRHRNVIKASIPLAKVLDIIA
jgi:hypothetical protein